MKLARKVGSTSQILQIFIQDSSSTTGAGLAGLTNASSSLTAYYHRDTDTTATAISLVTMTVGTFISSGFKEVDATNMPGWYQFCPPNAALATGAASVGIHLKGATNMAPLPIEIDLDAQVDVTHFGGTAGTFASGRAEVNATHFAGTISAGTAGYTAPDWGHVNAPTSTVNLSGTTISTGQAITSVSGAVGSVTGAVGSVTGNVGGNVVGSVASVTAAVTLPAIPTDWITAAGLATDAVTEIAGGMLDAVAASYDTAGTIGEKINATGGGGGGDIVSVNGTTFSGPNVPAMLADGVAHGGTSASLTLDLLALSNDVGPCLTIASGADVPITVSGFGGAMFIHADLIRLEETSAGTSADTCHSTFFFSIAVTGGTFTITAISDVGTTPNPQVTAAINLGATASAIHSAIVALSNVASAIVSGSGYASDPYVISIVVNSGDAGQISYDETSLVTSRAGVIQLTSAGDLLDGMQMVIEDGHGVSIRAGGTGKHGITSTGGTDGDGFHGLGAGTGVGFRSAPDAVGLGATAAAAAAAVLTTSMTESYNADGAAPTLAQALFVIMQRLTEFSISSTTITVKKLDGTTSAYTLTMDAAASTATSSTRAT